MQATQSNANPVARRARSYAGAAAGYDVASRASAAATMD